MYTVSTCTIHNQIIMWVDPWCSITYKPVAWLAWYTEAIRQLLLLVGFVLLLALWNRNLTEAGDRIDLLSIYPGPE